jgi:hypothetical protein
MHAATVVVGDQLGLYRALAQGGAQTADELAAATGCQPRLVREWLNAQVASAYCEYDPVGKRYWLDPEQAACLADPDSPTFVAGGALVSSAVHQDTECLRKALMGDGGIGWDEHHRHLFTGTERFFGTVYRANLVGHWIPALNGVEEEAARGGEGCRHRLRSRRPHPAHGRGLPGLHLRRLRLPRALHRSRPGNRRTQRPRRPRDLRSGRRQRLSRHRLRPYLCIQRPARMGQPRGRRPPHPQRPGRRWHLDVHRTAHRPGPDRKRARTNILLGVDIRMYAKRIVSGGNDALGAQAGEDRLRKVVEEAGFRRFRRATQTPTFMVLEAGK